MKRYNAPKVKESRGIRIFTTIWLVPFLAMVIALWLAYQYYLKIGSKITIQFKTNAGLIENQSPIKMRNVNIGIVKKISLSQDGKGVIVKAQMNREVEKYLNANAKFWIVHPNVGSQGITGLDTIVSGSYIELHSKIGGEKKYKYIGLEHPYIDDDAKGIYLVLSAPESYNVSEKGIIYYRMMEIGRVERVSISPNGTRVIFTIFIEEEYIKFINNKSKFYARGNFDLDFSRQRLDVSVAPFQQIIHGGISVYTPVSSLDRNGTTVTNRIFPLYKNIAEMKSKQLGSGGESRVYKLVFDKPINRLQIGSPIEFKGFQVGYITDIENRYIEESKGVKSTIYALIHTTAFSLKDRDIVNRLIEEDGLKARLASSIPIVGSEFIELFFDEDNPTKVKKEGKYFLIPTTEEENKKGIMDSLNELVAKLKNLPLENLLYTATKLVDENRKPINSLVKDLDRTIQSFNQTIVKLDTTVDNLNRFTANQELHEIPNSVTNLLNELELTLVDIQRLTNEYGGESQFVDQLSVTLEAISEASKSLDKTSRMLYRNPNALVTGED